MQRVGEREQRIAREKPSVRIVRVHHDGEIRPGERADVGCLLGRMPGQRRDARMLRIGRAQHHGAPGRRERRHEGQQDLAAGRRDDVIGRRRPERLGGDRGEPIDRGRLGQPGEGLGREPRHGIRKGIDPGRQVDERLRGGGEQSSGGVEIAAVP